MFRWLGFILVISGAAAAGINMAAGVKKSWEMHRDMLNALQEMRAEIEFHLTPLGELCGMLAETCPRPLGDVFLSVKDKLDAAPGRSAGIQMRQTMLECGRYLPGETKKILTELFDALGRQDVYAQLRAIDLAQQRTKSAMDVLEMGKKDRCRTYRMIGVCAGVAVAVILI